MRFATICFVTRFIQYIQPFSSFSVLGHVRHFLAVLKCENDYFLPELIFYTFLIFYRHANRLHDATCKDYMTLACIFVQKFTIFHTYL